MRAAARVKINEALQNESGLTKVKKKIKTDWIETFGHDGQMLLDGDSYKRQFTETTGVNFSDKRYPKKLKETLEDEMGYKKKRISKHSIDPELGDGTATIWFRECEPDAMLEEEWNPDLKQLQKIDMKSVPKMRVNVNSSLENYLQDQETTRNYLEIFRKIIKATPGFKQILPGKSFLKDKMVPFQDSQEIKVFVHKEESKPGLRGIVICLGPYEYAPGRKGFYCDNYKRTAKARSQADRKDGFFHPYENSKSLGPCMVLKYDEIRKDFHTCYACSHPDCVKDKKNCQFAFLKLHMFLGRMKDLFRVEITTTLPGTTIVSNRPTKEKERNFDKMLEDLEKRRRH